MEREGFGNTEITTEEKRFGRKESMLRKLVVRDKPKKVLDTWKDLNNGVSEVAENGQID